MTTDISKLCEKIKQAADAYYNGTPIMEDHEFDEMVDYVREHDPSNPILRAVGAPVRANSVLQKVKSVMPMGSLDKVKTFEEFDKFSKDWDTEEYVVQPKLDGISIELVYRGGRLVRASTRGGGDVGEDVTHTVKRSKTLPKTINHTGDIAVRGEAVIDRKVFKQHFSDFKNERNMVSGLLRAKDVDGRVELLDIVVYDQIFKGKWSAGTYNLKQEFLADNGFVVAETKYLHSKKALFDYISKYDRSTNKYLLDGLVIKTLNSHDREDVEAVKRNGRPEYQVAYKFKAETAKAVVRDVVWQVGTTSRITPVALIDPTDIGGVTISRVSLHNHSNLKQLNLHVGDTVLLSRRNDVIPQIEEVVKSSNGRKLAAVTTCPACHGAVEERGDFLYCASPDSCVGTQRGNIKVWIKTLELDQLGESFITDVMDADLVVCPHMLYSLLVSDLTKIGGYGEKKAQTIIDSINSKKNISMELFIEAINIPGVGHRMASDLVSAGAVDYSSLMAMSSSQMSSIEGIGEATAEKIHRFLHHNLAVDIKKLYDSVGVQHQVKSSRGKLAGQSFCFTGALSIKRNDAQKIVLRLGGDVKTGVGKGLTYLVQADPASTSTKSKKAQQYGTKVIGEQEFMDMVDFSVELLRNT